MDLWVVCHILHGTEFEVNGIFDNLQDALNICSEGCVAVLFKMNEDVTNETKFFMATPDRPEGFWA